MSRTRRGRCKEEEAEGAVCLLSRAEGTAESRNLAAASDRAASRSCCMVVKSDMCVWYPWPSLFP